MKPKNPLYTRSTCLRQKILLQTRSTHTATAPNQPSQQPPNQTTKIPLHELSPSDLCYYWDTKIPNASQLAYAQKFFQPSRHSPIKLWSASKFRTTPLESTTPEVVFLGRSNVGKSSLLNAVMGQKICWTSSKPGRTREMNAFGIGGLKGGHSRIVLLDMPGYGKASRAEWGVEIMKYLQRRRQLRRAFLLVDGSHGLKQSDKDILSLFRQYAIPHQIVLSKVDKLLARSSRQIKTGASPAEIAALKTLLEELKPVIQPDGRTGGPGALGEIVTCSAETPIGGGEVLGINALRWAILSSTGFDGTIGVKSDAIPSARPVNGPTANA